MTSPAPTRWLSRRQVHRGAWRVTHVLDEAIMDVAFQIQRQFIHRQDYDDHRRIRSLIAALRVLRRERDRPLEECPCCGWEATADSVVYDGQPLACGCAGQWSVDAEQAYVSLDGDPCPAWARCRK